MQFRYMLVFSVPLPCTRLKVAFKEGLAS